MCFSLRTKKILLGYFFASILSGLGFATWRTILMLRHYDPYTKEYAIEAKAPLQIYGYTLFIAVLLLLTAAFFFIRSGFLRRKYEFSEISVSNHQSTTFTSSLLGFLFIAVFVFLTLSVVTMLLPSQYTIFRYTQLISFILLPVVGVYFILKATEANRFVTAKKVLSLAPPVWCLLFMITSYINPIYSYKDFNHILCTVSLCALLCYFLYEAKSVITKKQNIAHFIFSLIAIVLCMAYILPNFILLAYWELTPELHFIFEAVEIGAIIYMASVSLLLISSLKNAVSEQTEEIEYVDFQEYKEANDSETTSKSND